MKKTLALIQMNVVAGDVEHNYKHVVELLDEAMGVFRSAREIDETAHIRRASRNHESALIMSGRKPAQCCSPAITTGTWR